MAVLSDGAPSGAAEGIQNLSILSSSKSQMTVAPCMIAYRKPTFLRPKLFQGRAFTNSLSKAFWSSGLRYTTASLPSPGVHLVSYTLGLFLSPTITKHQPSILNQRRTASDGSNMVVTTPQREHLKSVCLARGAFLDGARGVVNLSCSTGNVRTTLPEKLYPVAALLGAVTLLSAARVVDSISALFSGA